MAKGMKKLKETTRDRHLRWINHYSNNNFGIWIECTKCKKWRKSYNYSESHEVAENWCCSMNTLDNGTKGNCDDPEENTDEDFLEYSPGSIVWAKLDGYPWWPAMVDEDPDVEEYYWVEKNAFYYNVTFLDEHVTRAWISTKSIYPFLIPPHRNEHLLKHQKRKYSSAIKKAEEKAEIAVKMTVKDRLQKFSFVHLYKGKWPIAKDYEPEDDPRDITDILLDEVDDLDSLQSFESDGPDNFTLREKEKKLHEESRTVLSVAIVSVNAVKNKAGMNMDVADLTADTKNHAGKKQSNVNSSLPEIKDFKEKDEFKIMGGYCNNISKNKNIQSFENCTKIFKRSKNSNVSGKKIKTNIDTNKKNMLNDVKGNSSCCSSFDIWDNNKVEQNEKCLKIVEHELDRNSSPEDKNSKGKTSNPNISSVLSKISNPKNMDNINKSIDWVVNEYKIFNDIEIKEKKETNNDYKPLVTKEIKKFDVNKSSKKVLNGNNQKEVISFPHDKHLINGIVDMNKRKERETPEKSLGSNANGLNKKIKPSFNCGKQSFKTIKKEAQGSLKIIKQCKENNYSDFTGLSRSPNTKVTSSDNKNISLERNTRMLPNSNKVSNANEIEFQYQKSNPELIVKYEPFNNHCTSNSELSDVNSSSSKSDVGQEKFILNGLIPKETSNILNILSNIEMKEKTNKKDSETAICGAVKSKKLMKIHQKMKPVLPKNNKIMEPKIVIVTESSDVITRLSKSPNTKITSSDNKNISFEGNTKMLLNSNNVSNSNEFEYQKTNPELIVKCSGPLNNHCTSSSELSDVNSSSSQSGIGQENKFILIPKETSNNLSNTEMEKETNKKDSETAIYGADKSKKLVKIHKKIKTVLSKNNKIMEPKIEKSIERYSNCNKNHTSFNLTKQSKNITEINEVITVTDDNSTSNCSVNLPSKIKNPDVGFFDISLSDDEI